MPRLSIIVTCYNIEPYLEQCLDSVVTQTLRDIEIIGVDDGSTDATPASIERYAGADERIVPVLLGENSIGGVATAANAGLDRATGEYVGFADGDDFYDPTMFEKLLDAAVEHDADLAMCNYVVFDDETGESSAPADQRRWADADQPAYDLDPTTRKQFLRFIAGPWRKIYRRSLLEQNAIRVPVGDYFYEDNPFHWFSVISASRIALVPEALCSHRVARAGQTMSTVDARLFRIFEHHDTIHDWLDDGGLLEEYAPTLLGWVMSQMEWISARTTGDLRRQLFDILREIVEQYDDTTIERALTEGSKGERARSLSAAVKRNNFANFNRALDAPGKTGVTSRAMYHLRYSGVRRTAEIAKRYTENRVREGNIPLMSRMTRRTDVSNEDLFLALTVLEQRLAKLERRLEDIGESLDPDR